MLDKLLTGSRIARHLVIRNRGTEITLLRRPPKRNGRRDTYLKKTLLRLLSLVLALEELAGPICCCSLAINLIYSTSFVVVIVVLNSFGNVYLD
ncbi:hypothetical protein AVEN_133500-1 [Araneus ventricosus]|uniref:Uncharacterized protein n=1 Tax=Araneus ventricosus TaxID=182803 RepID=A0A4Y2WRX9_ARAVE|nr:hypothetical protein AVEN_82107-1 [Araneus ventricosus]GBO39488.1 hypothetical protein AVEN_213651-1 [Araneus ventricosus]GBO39522.1 hypothetical protein AVEN_238033-1 [Araneus ventricosus]GBO39525.1 hypothetical protein AVEN_133500-1 [Araneus ventricosus]